MVSRSRRASARWRHTRGEGSPSLPCCNANTRLWPARTPNRPEPTPAPISRSTRRGKDRDIGPAAALDAATYVRQQRPDQAVLGPGHIFRLQLHPPRLSLHLAYQQAGRLRPEVVASLAATHRQRVDDPDRASSGGERGLQHHRVVEVATGSPELTDWTNRPVSRAVVKQPPEHRRAVEPRETQPLDRPLPAQ